MNNIPEKIKTKAQRAQFLYKKQKEENEEIRKIFKEAEEAGYEIFISDFGWHVQERDDSD
jgi:predicted type IV restriction endonuclease